MGHQSSRSWLLVVFTSLAALGAPACTVSAESVAASREPLRICIELGPDADCGGNGGGGEAGAAGNAGAGGSAGDDGDAGANAGGEPTLPVGGRAAGGSAAQAGSSHGGIAGSAHAGSGGTSGRDRGGAGGSDDAGAGGGDPDETLPIEATQWQLEGGGCALGQGTATHAPVRLALVAALGALIFLRRHGSCKRRRS
jgi:hypothetical protein